MKRLILLRHGEAGFSDGMDFQRQLTPKGKENLHRLAEILSVSGLTVDFLHCSTATRTRETAEIIRKQIPIAEEQLSREIYEGTLESILKLLETTPKTAETCLLIGHNPTISLHPPVDPTISLRIDPPVHPTSSLHPPFATL